MVNNLNVCSVPFDELEVLQGKDERFVKGPLYEKVDIFQILTGQSDPVVVSEILDNKNTSRILENNLFAWKGVQRDMEIWDFEMSDVAVLVLEALINGNYINSQICEARPGGPQAACDSYKVSRKEWCNKSHKLVNYKYYVKFAITKTGGCLLMVSCHPEGA